jgi:hypothetical protein
MSETFAAALERLCDVARGQVSGYRRLLEATRAGTDALRVQDAVRFEQVLAQQVEALRDLKELERARAEAMREVGGSLGDPASSALDRELQGLAEDVLRENRVRRFVTSRQERLVETRVAFHRRAGTITGEAPGSLDQRA